MPRALLALLLCALVGLGAAVTAARADDDHDARDHDRARRAREAGEILPLVTVLTNVEREFTGKVIEVELDRDDGRWVYEFELLTPAGSVLELTYDAATGRFLEGEGSGLDAARKASP